MTIPAIDLQVRDGALTYGLEQEEIISSAALANADCERLSDNTVVLGFSTDTPTHMKDICIGPVKCIRWVACARNKLWWMTPEWGTSMSELPTETQFLLLQHNRKGPYSVIIPLVDGRFRCTLKAERDRKLRPLSQDLTLRIESGDQNVKGSKWPSALLVATGRDIFKLIEESVAQAARLSGTAKPLAAKQLPESLDYFGWCTWDAFYSTGVQAGLKSLNAEGIKPRVLIIDDGWQMTHVDEDYEGAKTTKAKRLGFLGSRGEEFEESEQAVLSAYADALSGGTEMMTTMPALADPDVLACSTEMMTTMPALADPDYGTALKEHLRKRDPQGDPEIERIVAKLEELRKKVKLNLEDMPQIERTVLQLAKKPKEKLLWARVLQRLAGWALGVIEVLFLLFYQYVVDPAGPNTWPVAIFRRIATGPLKGNLLNFFAVSGDFTKRIISVKANGKFSRPDATADEGRWFTEAEDFRTVTAHLRSTFGVQFIICWHGLPAYWGGVMPESPEFEELKPSRIYPVPTPGLAEIEPAMLWNPAVVAGIGVVEDSEGLYNRMHRYLAASGVDGVKVDCQAGVGLVGSVIGGGATIARKYHANLETSIARHFPGNHAINCMCHSTENLYQMRDTAIVRASDDFYPREDASSHPHIAACAYNSLFLSPLLQPDWDMFQSEHPAAHLHACARAVSGGSVYVSDKVGKHDGELLRKLVLRDGSVLRAERPGLPTEDCIFCDPLQDGETILKVWNRNRFTGIIGAFNIQGAFWDRKKRRFSKTGHRRTLSTTVTPWDVACMKSVLDNLPGPWAGAFASLSSRTHGITLLDSVHGEVAVTLSNSDGEIVTMVPLVEGANGVRFGPLGLENMLNSGGAVAGWKRESDGFALMVRGEGVFVASSSAPPRAVEVDGKRVKNGNQGWAFESGRLAIDVPPADGESVKHSIRLFF